MDFAVDSGQRAGGEPAPDGLSRLEALHPRLALGLRQVLLAALYVGAARLGLMMDAVSGFATLVWPGSGIALCCLLRGGPRLWPGVAAGAFLVNVWAGAPLPVAACIGAGNTLEALVAALALRRVRFDPNLTRLSDVVALVVLAAALSTLLSAGIGVLSLHVGGLVQADALWPTLRAWWLGDAIGDVVLTPLLLTWTSPRRAVAEPARRLEAMALAIATLACGLLIFDAPPDAPGAEFRQAHMLFLMLVWAALRLTPRGAATVTFGGAALAIYGAARGHGPFVHSQLNYSLLLLQGFMLNFAIIGLFLSVAIAERRRTQRALHRQSGFLRAITDGTSDSIFIKDRAGRYELINAAGAHAVGKQVDELIGKDDTALFPALDARNVMLADRAIMESGCGHTYEEPVTIDGRTVTFLSVKAPYRDEQGDVIGLVGISRDISDRKAAEDRAQQAISLRDEFLSIASHELRTPLSALILLLGSAQRAARGESPPRDQQRLPEKIDKAVHVGHRLSRLIDNLLDVSRLSKGRLELNREPCDLGELVRETVERFAAQAQRAGCALSVEAAPAITGQWDPLRIEQVVTNLLSNAIKYGAGAPIEIGVEGDAAEAVLRVVDHGIGISPSDWERVFTRFERAVPLRHYGGLGLGLYITRQIVEAHAGRIAISATSTRGATFTVSLPR